MTRRIRIGIDVGGTFTHAVAIDAESLEIAGTTNVPTTHTHEKGVAQGIIDSLYQLLKEAHIDPNEVILIAHSTTQATNALLEGDVAPVGILGMGSGIEKIKARGETQLGKFELSPGKFLPSYHRFLDTSDGLDPDKARQLLEELINEGAKVIVAAESFSVDNPENEQKAIELATEMQLLATPTYLISQLYGLRARTRTAAINASMLPRMLETANMTEESVRSAGIKAPLMIMRSDGGIMDINEMRRRPILTMLSGPAAGVAAALMFLRISDGIFVEVGGTSTDISAIRYGKALIRSATVGGHRLYLRTLDVRTVGLAGGSMPRIRHGKIHDVGPRSAHIAQLHYASFTPLGDTQIKPQLISPLPGDPDDYLMLEAGELRLALTTTCAANLLGLIPEGDSAHGNLDSINKCFTALSQMAKATPEKLAESLLEHAYPKVARVVQQLIQDYKLDPALLILTGGGGGAPAVVPYTAKKMNLPFQIAPYAPVISAIGVAMAMVRESIERSVVDAKEDDILRIRRDAAEAVLKMGANPESVEVEIEIDPQRNLLRATATGTTEFRSHKGLKELPSQEQLEETVRSTIRAPIKELQHLGTIANLHLYQAHTEQKRALGLLSSRRKEVRVIDNEGIVRLQMRGAEVLVTPKSDFLSRFRDFISQHIAYGDAGREMPATFLIFRGRILNLSGLLSVENMSSLAQVELQNLSPEEPIAAITQPR